MTLILAADIGGTKSHLCLGQRDGDKETIILHEKIYASSSFDNATDLITTFLKICPDNELDIRLMCLALPGIVHAGRCSLTNLDWQLDSKQLEAEFDIEQVIFINDFEAAALGVLGLTARDYIVLNQGQPKQNSIKVVTGAGTGLGLAWLHHNQDRYWSNPTEGGHMDFSPNTDQQIALLKNLMQSFKHVSFERLLSGEGLQRIYQFITQQENELPSAEDISKLAHEGNREALQTLELFIEIYGSYIGNLALLFQPAGGIYIAGGIAAKHTARMTSKTFEETCLQKGRMQKLVKKTPIYLVTNERLGLQGAMWHAHNHLNKDS